MKIEELLNKKIGILGFGKEGKSTLTFLLSLGIKDITIIDRNTIKLKDNNIKIISGDKYLKRLGDFDIIIKSPGISLYNKDIYLHKDKITSQTQIFYNNYKGKIISVTATKGKSTIVSLVNSLLQKSGYKTKLVGNIGNPVLSEIDLLHNKYDFVIYELSSYMLDGLTKNDYISILSNIYPDHLDWHLNFENYKNAKLNILNNSENLLIGYKVLEKQPKDINIKNYYSFGGKNSFYSYKDNYFYKDGEKINSIIKTKLLGNHNLDNILCLFGISDILNIDYKFIYITIKDFLPLKHRLEKVLEYNGITFIDDAISTTPESTIEAIKTFGNKIGTIVLGGLDRGYNFKSLIQTIKEYDIKNIVLFPDSGTEIFKLLDDSFTILHTKSMIEAVNFGFSNTGKGKICLLSTASPSYNLWKNFEEKGTQFKNAIKNHIEK